MDFEYFTVGGGWYLYTFFNAVAAIAQSQAFRDAVLGASVVGGGWLTLNIAFEQRWNSTGTWFATLAIVLYGFTATTATVKITDTISHADSGGYTVSNVPFGLAFFGAITNNAGKLMTDLFEQNFADVDAPMLQEHGFMFGSRLLVDATRMEITDSNFSDSFSSFIRNCVFYDLLQGRKNIEGLKRAADPFEWIVDDPHLARMFVFSEDNGTEVDTTLLTCDEGVDDIRAGMGNAVTDAEGRLAAGATTTADPRGRAAILGIVVSDLGDFHNYLIGTARSSSQILQRQITINSILRGPAEWLGETGNDAAMKDYIDARLQLQTRQSYSSVGRQAEKWVPILKATFQCVYIAIFPFAILLMVTPIGGTVIRNYLLGLVWIESWGPLFSILNYMMNSSAKAQMQSVLAATGTNTDISLFAQAGIQDVHADIATQAGYLSMSVPFISIALAAGVGRFAYLASSTLAVSQEAVGDTTRESATGQLAIGNTSYDNHSAGNYGANKWDSNLVHNANEQRATTPDGAEVGQFGDGGNLVNQARGDSPLTDSLNLQSQVQSGISSAATESDRHLQSETARLENSQSTGLAYTAAHANAISTSDTSGYNVTAQEQAQLTEAQTTINDAAESLSQKYDISHGEAVRVTLGASAGGPQPAGFFNGKAGLEYNSDAKQTEVWDAAQKVGETEQVSEALSLVNSTSASQSAGFSASDTDTYNDAIQANKTETETLQRGVDTARQRAEEWSRAEQYSSSDQFTKNSNLNQKYVDHLQDQFGWDAVETNEFLDSQAPEVVSQRNAVEAQFTQSAIADVIQQVNQPDIEGAHGAATEALVDNADIGSTADTNLNIVATNPSAEELAGVPGTIDTTLTTLTGQHDTNAGDTAATITETGDEIAEKTEAQRGTNQGKGDENLAAVAISQPIKSAAEAISPHLAKTDDPYGGSFSNQFSEGQWESSNPTPEDPPQSPGHPLNRTPTPATTGGNEGTPTPASPDTASTNLDTNTNLGNDSQSTGGGGGHIASGAGDNQEAITPASPDTASATPDTNANLGDDSQSTGGGHIASDGTGGNEGTPAPASPDTASATPDTNTALGNDNQSTVGAGAHIASGAGDNEGTPTPASQDIASTNLDTNTALGDDSQATAGVGGHIASGAGDNEPPITPASQDTASATPANAAAFEQTSDLSDAKTPASTKEDYVPLDTNLGDDTQSSKGKSAASEEDNKDDAPATGGHGQGNRKPTDWK